MLKKNKKYLFDKDEEIFDSDAEQAAPDGKYDAAIDAYAKYRSAAMQRDKAYSDIVNRKDFSYNVNNDAMYDQLVREYTEGASRAAEDAMGRAAAMTGGYGNSYAQQVSQQTFQDYMGGLDAEADKLYDRALDRYLLQGDLLNEKYALATDRVKETYADYVATHPTTQPNAPAEEVEVATPSENLKEYIDELGTYTTQEEAEAYIDRLEVAGLITPDEGEALFGEYVLSLPLAEENVQNRVQGYEAYVDENGDVDDGGWNWGGIDRNAKVVYTFKNGDTETLTLGQLFRKLINSGMSRREARNEIYQLQHDLNISDRGKIKN